MLSFENVIPEYYYDDEYRQSLIKKMKKVVFAVDNTIRGVMIHLPKKPETADDLYQLAVKLRTISNNYSDHFVLTSPHDNNRGALIAQLVQDAAKMGHVLAKQWLENLYVKDEKYSSNNTIKKLLKIVSPATEVDTSPQVAPSSSPDSTASQRMLFSPISTTSSDGRSSNSDLEIDASEVGCVTPKI